ncbi:MAG TPA: hypothetical protein VJT75_17075 [Thermoleophilaceae bacterium]|nr:hypothetical protein [Thermoleophilaceae bacterium]
MALVLVALVGVVIPSFANGGTDPAVRQVAPPPGDPQTAAADREARDHQAREEAALDTPEAHAERADSQDAYQHLSSSEALATARAAFGDFINEPFWSPPELADAERISHYATDYGAIVERPGADLLLESTAPLRSVDDSGSKEPVDSSLVADRDSLAPASAPVEATIAKDPAGGVELTDGIRVGAAGEGSGSDAAVVDDKAFFANVGEGADTDLIVGTAPHGIEAAFLLRSVESPEDPALSIELPEAASLAVQNDLAASGSAPQGSASVTRNGETLATVMPPIASDADGQTVAASYEARGSDLVIHVDHRGADVRYPILVDPYIVENYNGNAGDFYNANNPGPKWEYYEEDPDFNGSQGGSAPGGTGLRLNMPTSPPTCCYYPAGTSAQWQWQAPANTQIVRADFQRVAHDFNSSLVRIGILGWVPSLGQFKWQGDPSTGDAPWVISGLQTDVSNQICTDVNSPCATGGASDANWAIYQFESTGGGNPRARSNYTAMNQVITYLWDRYPPTIAPATVGNQAPGGWVDDKVYGVPLTANDLGLGVKSVALKSSLLQFASAINTPLVNGSPCSGELRSSRCPNEYASTLYYATTALPEGDNAISLTARDIVGATNGGTCSNGSSDPCGWHVKVDRTPPSIASISGSLWDHRNLTADHRNEGLYDPSYQLSVAASDANNGRPTSGLKTISFQVDGVNKATQTAACAGQDNCADTLSWTFNPDDYSDGDHTITVVAKDALADQPGVNNAYHTKTSSFQVTVDRRGDIYHAVEYDADPAGGGSNLGEEWAQIGTQNARHEDLDSIETRNVVPCVANPSGCAQLRFRTRLGETDPTAADRYTIDTALAPADDRFTEQSDLLAPANSSSGTLAGTAPINGVLQPWQTAPPAHGSTYSLYETTDDAFVDGVDSTETRRLYLDTATKLPLRDMTLYGTKVESDVYYSYDRGRLTTSQVPPDEFAVSRPTNVSAEDSTTLSASEPVLTPHDPPVDDVLKESKLFREQFGLRSDDAFVQSVIDDDSLNTDDFGVPLQATELADLRNRLVVQDQLDPITAWGAAHPDVYAGLYIDEANGGLIYVGFTSNAAANLDQVKATFAYPALLRSFTAARTSAAVKALHERVVGDWDAGLLDTYHLGSVAVNTSRNSVIARSETPTPGLETQLQSVYGPGIQLEEEHVIDASQTSPDTKRLGPMDGGLTIYPQVNGNTCTSGFQAHKSRSGKQVFYTLTAGHCNPGHGSRQDGWLWGHPQGNPSSGKCCFGRSFNDSLSGSGVHRADALSIRLRPKFKTNKIYYHVKSLNDHFRSITSVRHSTYQGLLVCQAGAASFYLHCGEIEDYNYTRHNVRPLTRVDFKGRCDTREGDSGAPVVRGQGAVGLTSMLDTGDCPYDNLSQTGNKMYYSQIEEALQYTGNLGLYKG